MSLLLLAQYLRGSFVVVTRNLNVYSNICHMLYVNTEKFYFNYEINSAYAYDSFDNNVNNKLNRAEVIVKDPDVIKEN